MKFVASLFFLSIILGSFNAHAQETAKPQPLSFLVVPEGYTQKLVKSELGNAVSFTFDFEGGFIVAEKIPDKKNEYYRIIKLGADGQKNVLLEKTSQKILSLSFSHGQLYVVTRGRIMVLSKGKLKDVVMGLPAYGDYSMSSLVFYGTKMYFGVGTTTNAGIVGPDNAWLGNYPAVHDLPCADIKVAAGNVETENFLTSKRKDKALTGPFQPFNTPISENGEVRRSSRCSGAVYEADFDGSNLRVYAWGFHHPKSISPDEHGNLYVLDQGMEDRGVRPIKNGVDSLFRILPDTWHGWPDYSGGNPVDAPALLASVPNTPPLPARTFVLNELLTFAVVPAEFLPQSGLALTADNRIVATKLISSEIGEFISTSSQGQVPPVIKQFKFGPDGKLYVLLGLGDQSQLHEVARLPGPRLAGTQANAFKFSSGWMSNLMLLGLGLTTFYLVNARQRPAI